MPQVCKFDRQGYGCEMFEDQYKSKGNTQVDNCHLFTFFYCLTFTLFRNNDNLRDDLAAFKKQVELLKEQVG